MSSNMDKASAAMKQSLEASTWQ